MTQAELKTYKTLSESLRPAEKSRTRSEALPVGSTTVSCAGDMLSPIVGTMSLHSKPCGVYQHIARPR